MEIIEKIQQWVIDRNLHTADPRIQMCKTVEEIGELANSLNKNNLEGAKDGIGDTVVTLICISQQLGLDFIDCLETAYNEIKDRKGRMVNGVFVKEQDLSDTQQNTQQRETIVGTPLVDIRYYFEDKIDHEFLRDKEYEFTLVEHVDEYIEEGKKGLQKAAPGEFVHVLSSDGAGHVLECKYWKFKNRNL